MSAKGAAPGGGNSGAAESKGNAVIVPLRAARAPGVHCASCGSNTACHCADWTRVIAFVRAARTLLAGLQ